MTNIEQILLRYCIMLIKTRFLRDSFVHRITKILLINIPGRVLYFTTLPTSNKANSIGTVSAYKKKWQAIVKISLYIKSKLPAWIRLAEQSGPSMLDSVSHDHLSYVLLVSSFPLFWREQMSRVFDDCVISMCLIWIVADTIASRAE